MTIERNALLRLMHEVHQLKVLTILMLEALPAPEQARANLLCLALSRLEELDQAPAVSQPDATRDLNSLRLRDAVSRALAPREKGGNGGD